jgi:photosystem II stability/assembly factor-like uncharacterized protein
MSRRFPPLPSVLITFLAFLLVAGILLLPVGFGSSSVGSRNEDGVESSQWQGTVYPRIQSDPAPRQQRFLVLDTGGSGGSFGKGDLRKNLLDVFFWDQNRGWACGDGGVFKTEKGGLSWERVKPRSQHPARWRHVVLSGPGEIWLLEGFHGQAQARLWHSRDDGQTWQEELVGQLRGAADLRVHGDHLWVLAGDFPSYHSGDGGRSWQRLQFGNLLSGTVQMAIPLRWDGATIYVLGHRQKKPRLIKSGDGGNSWQALELPQPLPEPHWQYRLFFVTQRSGWLGLPGGQILLTTDGGQHWVRRDLPTDQAVTALWFDRPEHGFVAVNNNDKENLQETLYETWDAGQSWVPVLGGKAHVNALFGLNSTHVWAVGNVPGIAANDLVAILQPGDKVADD